MGMFDNFNTPSTDIPSNIFPNHENEDKKIPEFDLDHIKPNHHVRPYDYKLPFTDYNKEGEITGYWWYEGNQLVLEFEIDGEVVIEGADVYSEARDFLKDKTTTLKFFNFRGEQIYSRDYSYDELKDEGDHLSLLFFIDEKITKMFHKGVYSCSLEVTRGNEFALTIFDTHYATLTVK